MKYPDIHVPMIGEDGNSFAILARAMKAMREAGLSQEKRALFVSEATSGDYDHLIGTVMEWFDTD